MLTLKERFDNLDNLYDYVEEQKDRADIDEDTHDILQHILNELEDILW